MRLSGAAEALRLAYSQAGRASVAFIDETFDVDPAHPRHFYVMAAVVVQCEELDGLRAGLVDLAGSSYWHTSEALRTEAGRERTREMLDYLGNPEGTERCVVRHHVEVAPSDSKGEEARAECLGELLAFLAQAGAHGSAVGLFVLERRRVQREANADATTKATLVAAGRLPSSARMIQVTPGQEQLLWLPDVVCSAYRRDIVHGETDYFRRVAHITEVV